MKKENEGSAWIPSIKKKKLKLENTRNPELIYPKNNLTERPGGNDWCIQDKDTKGIKQYLPTMYKIVFRANCISIHDVIFTMES